MTVHLYIPTLNGGQRFLDLLEMLGQQTLSVQRCVIVDSGSTDGTVAAARAHGYEVIGLDGEGFDHGGTRQRAIDAFPGADVYCMLTQDAVPADEFALARLVEVFKNPEVGLAYGRQLPHRGATLQESHARLFNYSPQHQLRALADAPTYGIKTISCSNSFAAYRREALAQVGGFPRGTIMGEDVIVAGRVLLADWKMAYVADACVYHSHNYTLREEFERYFDIGVFHADNRWIFKAFGHAGSEGLRYALSEIRYVGRRNPLLLAKVGCSLVAKRLGYKLGLSYRRLPPKFRKACSMYKGYWK